MQKTEPTLEECVEWLHQNINTNSYCKKVRTTYTTSFEKNGADPNLAKFAYNQHTNKSTWTDDIEFRFSDIESFETKVWHNSQCSVYWVQIQVKTKGGKKSIKMVEGAGGNAMLGSKRMNGTEFRQYSVHTIWLKALDTEQEALELERKINKVFARTLELTSKNSNTINDNWFK